MDGVGGVSTVGRVFAGWKHKHRVATTQAVLQSAALQVLQTKPNVTASDDGGWGRSVNNNKNSVETRVVYCFRSRVGKGGVYASPEPAVPHSGPALSQPRSTKVSFWSTCR